MSEVTARQVLENARKLIESPDRWTRKAFARSKIGIECWSGDPDAVSWCVQGAINEAGRRLGTGMGDSYFEAMPRLQKAAGCWMLDIWNDNAETTHADILEAFDKAINMEAGDD